VVDRVRTGPEDGREGEVGSSNTDRKPVIKAPGKNGAMAKKTSSSDFTSREKRVRARAAAKMGIAGDSCEASAPTVELESPVWKVSRTDLL
jgi:hypothetical protein